MDRTQNTIYSVEKRRRLSLKLRRIHFLMAGILSSIAILGFGFLSPGPSLRNIATQANDAASLLSGDVTRPSSFPNVKIKNFGQMDEHFYRGAQPKPEDYKTLAALGIKTMIDLRDDPTSYEKREAEAAGMKYVNIAMSDKDKPKEEQVTTFLNIAKDPASWPFYVHCAGGRHRTGLIGAVYRYNLYGWDFDKVYVEMKNYDYYSRWGHGAIKDYVAEYYDGIKAKLATTQNVVEQMVNTQTNDAPSEPVTPPPPPKPKE
jgi:protein tyrosine/serine phosphatase